MANHLGFMVSQAAHIERTVYMTQYPDIQYSELVPVDRSAHPWARTITHYSTDITGEALPIAGRTTSIPLADVTRAKHDVTVEMAAIGYDYSLEEIRQAMMIGVPLTADKAMAARRAAEEYIDKKVLEGDADKGWDSLINSRNTLVDRFDVAEGASGANAAEKRLWSNKDAKEIIKDINDALNAIYADTSTVEMADTIGLPPNIWSDLVSKFIDGTAMSVANAIEKNNVYTKKTGRRLMIREIRGLEKAGNGNTGRMLVYRRDPSVLKLHMPMPFRFLPVQKVLLTYIVPGIFRLGGLEIRRPKAIRYYDGITAAA